MGDQNIQILREIDKLDRIGLDGVCAMLGNGLRDASGAFNPGIGLMPIQIGMIRLFFEETTGHDTNEKTLDAMAKVFSRLRQIRCRIDLMCCLEETAVGPNETAWDRLILMPQNEDETWSSNGRPKNIAWALDDIVKLLRSHAHLKAL